MRVSLACVSPAVLTKDVSHGPIFAGLYHFGHVLGLLEAGVLPHIISGTSGGSVIGAIICTRTDDEIRQDLHPEILIQKLTCFDRPWGERLKGLVRDGCLFSFDIWMEKIKWYVSRRTLSVLFHEHFMLTYLRLF